MQYEMKKGCKEKLNQGIFIKPIVTIYDSAYIIRNTEKGIATTISDEGIYGHTFTVVDNKACEDFIKIRTHYNYEGYVKKSEVLLLDNHEMKALLRRRNHESDCTKYVIKPYADILTIPSVQGVRIISLSRGAVIELLEYEENNGYTKVRLYDGQIGYIKSSYLKDYVPPLNGDMTEIVLNKNNNNEIANKDLSTISKSDIDESNFREDVVKTAKSYLGTQYRWGGKTPLGLDCSGLTSISYMLNGILIFRDAKIVEGFPVKEISFEEKKPGDLIYFPGHIAMYIGNDEYIHSTAHTGSDGVVINSFNREAVNYRADLAGKIVATGSVF